MRVTCRILHLDLAKHWFFKVIYLLAYKELFCDTLCILVIVFYMPKLKSDLIWQWNDLQRADDKIIHWGLLPFTDLENELTFCTYGVSYLWSLCLKQHNFGDYHWSESDTFYFQIILSLMFQTSDVISKTFWHKKL